MQLCAKPDTGFQEALVRQVNDLAELLGNDWAWVRRFALQRLALETERCNMQIGVVRDDGKQAGEFSPIFYKKWVLSPNHYTTSLIDIIAGLL